MPLEVPGQNAVSGGDMKLVTDLTWEAFDADGGLVRTVSVLVVGEVPPGEDAAIRIVGCLSPSGAAIDLPRAQYGAAIDALIEESNRLDLAIAEAHRVGMAEGRSRSATLARLIPAGAVVR